MFCPFCGNTVADGHSFCNVCGKPLASASAPAAKVPAQDVIEVQAQQYLMQKEATRKAELETLQAAHSHFAQKSGQFRDYDGVCEKVNHYGRGAKAALLVWGCIVSSLGLLGSIVSLSEYETPLPFLLIFLLPGLAMVTGGILMKVNNRKKLARFKEHYSNLSWELFNHYLACSNCPVPMEYANPEILEQLMRILHSGRADTIKEGLSVLLASTRQSKIQEYLKELAENVSDVAEKTGVRALFLPASFFQ